MVNPTYSIGVDGGGTKTDLILVDAAGNIVAQNSAPGCSPSHVGIDRARTILLAALETLLAASKIDDPKPKISATKLFMAGSGNTWREIAALLHGFGTVTNHPDSLPVLELATHGAPGIVLHAGTGSFVAARAPDGTIHYAGGLGWRFGDPGSGYELGRRGIAAALIELQGWSPNSGLGEALKTHTALTDAPSITRFFYSEAETNARIAAFAPRVIELAQQGCRPAQIALAGSIAELVAQARLVTDKLFPGAKSFICGVSGAVLNNPAAVYALNSLASTHAWPAEFRLITEPPVEGVRRLLLRG